MVNLLLSLAIVMQAVAVVYGIRLLLGHRTASRAPWLWLLGAMASMLAWRVVVVSPLEPPPFFNPMIAIWGSTCMLAAMFFFGREVARRTAAEGERDALLASERAARSEAERASRLKDDFLPRSRTSCARRWSRSSAGARWCARWARRRASSIAPSTPSSATRALRAG